MSHAIKEESTNREICAPPRKKVRCSPTCGASSSSEMTSQASRPPTTSHHSRQPRRSARIAQQSRASSNPSPSPEVIDLITPPRASPGELLHSSPLPSHQSNYSSPGGLYRPSNSVMQSTQGGYGPPHLNTAAPGGPPPLRETVIRSAARHSRSHQPSMPSQLTSDLNILGTLGHEDEAYPGIPTLSLSPAHPSAIRNPVDNTDVSYTHYHTPVDSPPFPLVVNSVVPDHSSTGTQRLDVPIPAQYTPFSMTEGHRNRYPILMPAFDQMLPVQETRGTDVTSTTSSRSSRMSTGGPNPRAVASRTRAGGSFSLAIADDTRPLRRLVRSNGVSTNNHSVRTNRAQLNSDEVLGGRSAVPERPAIQRRDVELIVVDDSDSDDDVIIESYVPGPREQSPGPLQLDQDERYARELQASFDNEAEMRRLRVPVPFPGVPQHVAYQPSLTRYGHAGPSIGRPSTSQETDEGRGFIRDNFEALASRVNSWTRQDATRFLHMATRPGTRPPRSRRHFAHHMNRMPANVLIRAIVGDSAVRLSYEELLELAENIGPARPQGVSQETLDKFLVSTFTKTAENAKQRCVVCMCDYENKEKLRALPCAHDFHRDCIDQWLKDHNTCPICRVQIETD